jgi:hypothetical protein
MREPIGGGARQLSYSTVKRTALRTGAARSASEPVWPSADEDARVPSRLVREERRDAFSALGGGRQRRVRRARTLPRCGVTSVASDGASDDADGDFVGGGDGVEGFAVEGFVVGPVERRLRLERGGGGGSTIGARGRGGGGGAATGAHPEAGARREPDVRRT